MSHGQNNPLQTTPAQQARPGCPPSRARSAFRAELLSLVWEPLVLLLLAPVEGWIGPILTAPPREIVTGERMLLVSLLWGILYVLWMLPITLYRRCVLPRQVGLSPSWLRELARSVRILSVRSALVLGLVLLGVFAWVALGFLGALAGIAVPALLVVVVQRGRPTSDPAPITPRTLRELQQFAAQTGFPEVAVERADSPAAAPCSLDVRDGRSVVTVSPAFLDRAPEAIARAAVAHELAHHQADDVRRAALLGESAVVLATVPALAVIRGLAGASPGFDQFLAALPWAFAAYWAALTAALLAIRAWERRTERRASRRAMELVDDPFAVARAVAMVSAVPLDDANPLERLLYGLLSSHPGPDLIAEDARAHSHESR